MCSARERWAERERSEQRVSQKNRLERWAANRPLTLGALWLFAVLRLRNTLTYLLTYLLTYFTCSARNIYRILYRRQKLGLSRRKPRGMPTVPTHFLVARGRRSWGLRGCWLLWKYVWGVRVCFDPPKMSHSFIQNCCRITLQVSHHQWRKTCVENGKQH